MDDKDQKLRTFVSESAASLLKKTDNELNVQCFTEEQIERITDNYSSVLGEGGFSIVYKGKLNGGRPVAVKRYIFTAQKKEFTKEVIIQSQFSHKNIVRLLGCCVEADAPMLVTEFVPNGNLSDLLHGKNGHRNPLSLDRRLQIASDVAEALVYMHTSQSHPILHGDIKPENIFLNKNYMPKVSDFGISRLLSMSSDEYTRRVIGSMGYIDPVFCQTGRLTTKSDVYSFGVVLLELMTRRKAIDDDNNFLAKTFGLANTKSSRHEIFDKEIATTEDVEVLDDIVNLALKCVKFELEERPDIRDVSEYLRKIQRTREKKHRQQTGFKRFITKFQRTPDEKRPQVISPLQQAGFERFITKEQINMMTDNYNSFLTECFMGEIYRGYLRGLQSVEILKMSFQVDGGLWREFSHQMIVHSKLGHQNVVRFEGCCLDDYAPILVYESAETSLHDILFGDGSENWIFNSEERLRAAISIAEGLQYLHSRGIVHGDIRTANMLVVNAKNKVLHKVSIKVSGIGASVYLSMAEAAGERIKREENSGYMDPRFLKTGVLTKDADLYSFGIVLLELFTGKMASNRIPNCQLGEIWDKEDCRHIEGIRTMTFRFLNSNVRRRPDFAEAIKLFNKRIGGLYGDRCDGLFCNDNCAARMDS